jgi:hypothetical protein
MGIAEDITQADVHIVKAQFNRIISRQTETSQMAK